MNTSDLREEIINNNNNAQTMFIGYLNQLNSINVQEIRINDVLHGDLDFSILQDRGFKNIKSIIVEKEGEITSLLNIPDSVETIECNDQLLVQLENLPVSLLNLSINNNKITKFDCGSIPKLESLKISNNELIDIKNLPETLEVLECENNQLRELNLADCPALKILICSNNPILVLQNVPSSLTKLEMENNPFIEINENQTKEDEKKNKKKLDYLESLNIYFKLKTKYEEQLRKLKRQAYDKGVSKKDSRRKASSVKAPCIQCKRNVNTIFGNSDNRYIALCGDRSQPCDLNIKLYKGEYYDIHKLMKIYSEQIQEDKQDMIVSKMESIFKYVSDELASKTFEEDMKLYQETSTVYKDVETDYENAYNNIETKQQIFRKTDQIYQIMESMDLLKDEYKKTGNKKLLTTLVEMYNRDLEPAYGNLRLLKYKRNFVDIDDSSVPTKSILQQHPNYAHVMDYVYGDSAKVESFVINHNM